VSGFNKPKITDFRADYATHADFCDVFRNDTKRLYLLAFLLTANHEESERCFVSTIEEIFKEPTVFRECARSWVKRRLIENAIEIVSPASARNGHKREIWSARQHETQRECEIDTVTKLAGFERFVFVMSVLERYPTSDCARLLGCGMNEVPQARMRALCRLADLTARFPRGDQLPLRRLEITHDHQPSGPGSGVARSDLKNDKSLHSMRFAIRG
jgi:hypothetical protein